MSIRQTLRWSFFSGYGKTSRLNRNSGTQKLWITSLLRWVNWMERSVGSTSSGMVSEVPIVVTGPPVGVRVAG